MKKENKEPIYLDAEGYKQYLEEIEQIRGKLVNNGKQKSDAYVSAVGDGWHDNFAFEEAKREEYKIMCDLREKIAGLDRIVIVEQKEELNKKIADINDFVLVDTIFGDEAPSEELFKLVASSTPDIFAEISEISINSPIGKTIYQQQEGYRGNYTVNGIMVYVELKMIGKNLEEIYRDTKKMTRG